MDIVLTVKTHRNYTNAFQGAKDVVRKALAEYQERHGARSLWPITHIYFGEDPEKVEDTERKWFRFDNEKTIRDYCLEVLGKGQDLSTKKVAALIQDAGYKTKSSGFVNTVRLNLMNLQEDGLVNYDKDNRTWRAVKPKSKAS